MDASKRGSVNDVKRVELVSDVTWVAALTPAGRGAIAVVGVRGPWATQAVDRCFRSMRRRSIVAAPVGAVLLGTWYSQSDDNVSPGGGVSADRLDTASEIAAEPVGAAAGEELIVCRTSEDAWEVHCHGGQAAVEAIVLSLERQGCKRQDGRSFARHALDVGEHARLAWRDLPQATTQRVARILLDQARGALDEAFGEIEQSLAADDPNSKNHARALIELLLERGEIGRYLLTPRRIAFAGRPNVGKSSLINAIVGFERTLVTQQAGTTRDLVGVSTVIDGWPVELTDTAGIRVTSEPLEATGIKRSLDRWQQTDLRVLVEDLSHGPGDSIFDESALPPDLIVWNKLDLVQRRPAVEAGCCVSAVTGEGMEELVRCLSNRLARVDLPSGVAVPWTEEQCQTLRRWRSLV